MNKLSGKDGIWFVYDGECTLCKTAALALRIKEEYGVLNLLNAREAADHELMKAINARQYNLDEGMVIFDGEHFYHGKDALLFMAHFGENKGLFNILNKVLFGSDSVAKMVYPWMRGVRNLILKMKRVSKINNLD